MNRLPFAISAAGLLAILPGASGQTTVWFDRPAPSFHQSSIVGNGRLGAMDFGGTGVDRIVLGCTHYSFLAPLLNEVLGQRAQLVDVAAAVARQTQRLAGALARRGGKLQLHASAHPERLRAALPRLHLGRLAARLV